MMLFNLIQVKISQILQETRHIYKKMKAILHDFWILWEFDVNISNIIYAGMGLNF